MMRAYPLQTRTMEINAKNEDNLLLSFRSLSQSHFVFSLGGNTKTVMCANAGPAEYNYDETVSTLR